MGALPGNPPSSPPQVWGGGAVPSRWLSPALGWDVEGTGTVPFLLTAGTWHSLLPPARGGRRSSAKRWWPPWDVPGGPAMGAGQDQAAARGPLPGSAEALWWHPWVTLTCVVPADPRAAGAGPGCPWGAGDVRPEATPVSAGWVTELGGVSMCPHAAVGHLWASSPRSMWGCALPTPPGCSWGPLEGQEAACRIGDTGVGGTVPVCHSHMQPPPSHPMRTSDSTPSHEVAQRHPIR